MSGDEAKTKGTNEVWDQEDQNEYASAILEAIVEVDTRQNWKCDQNTVRDLDDFSTCIQMATS